MAVFDRATRTTESEGTSQQIKRLEAALEIAIAKLETAAKRKPRSKAKKPPKPIRLRVKGGTVTIQKRSDQVTTHEVLRDAIAKMNAEKAAAPPQSKAA